MQQNRRKNADTREIRRMSVALWISLGIGVALTLFLADATSTDMLGMGSFLSGLIGFGVFCGLALILLVKLKRRDDARLEAEKQAQARVVRR